MNKTKVNIWGREFELPVHYQLFSDDPIMEYQKKALEDVHYVDYFDAQDAVRDYIMKNYADEVKDQPMDNMFRYVMPKSIYIPKFPDTGRFDIMCDFKFDMEHGIAIEYEHRALRMIGAQDLVL